MLLLLLHQSWPAFAEVKTKMHMLLLLLHQSWPACAKAKSNRYVLGKLQQAIGVCLKLKLKPSLRGKVPSFYYQVLSKFIGQKANLPRQFGRFAFWPMNFDRTWLYQARSFSLIKASTWLSDWHILHIVILPKGISILFCFSACGPRLM